MMQIALFCAALSVTAQVNEKAIAKVAAGELKEAKASWWGFDPVESTHALQSAINSGAERIIVDNIGKPWIVDEITLAGNQTIVLERGVEVVAKKGAFKGKGDCLFLASLKENVTISGYGATLRMQRSDYDGPEYEKAEWRHCLSIRSCTNVRVEGLTLVESGGDGIYLGTAKDAVPNKNVQIRDVVCDRNYRQGISVINAEDLLIENTIMRDTGGTAPQAGIDFEPNRPEERLVNCVMRNCIIWSNAGDGIALYVPPLRAESAPLSMRFENCIVAGSNANALRIVTGNSPERAVKGSIEFVNCVFEGSRHAGIVVADKPVGGCSVLFRYCRVADVAMKEPGQSPIILMSRRGASEPVGGVRFESCLVSDSLDRNPMGCLDMLSVGVKDVSGKLYIQKEGSLREVVLTEEVLAKWMPASKWKAFPRVDIKRTSFRPLVEKAPAEKYSLEFVRLRRDQRLLLFARKGEKVSFRVRHKQVAKYSGKTIPLTVTSPSGEVAKKASLPFNEETAVSFTAPETGAYRIAVAPGANYVQFVGNSHPLNLSGEDGPIQLYRSLGDYFFWVPPGTREFGVRVFGEGMGEAVKAALIDPSGKLVEEQDNIIQTYQFEVSLSEESEGQVWLLRVQRPSGVTMEDHSVDLRAVPPVLAPSRESLLVPAE